MTIKVQETYLYGLLKRKPRIIQTGERVRLGMDFFDADYPALEMKVLNPDKIELTLTWREAQYDGPARQRETTRTAFKAEINELAIVGGADFEKMLGYGQVVKWEPSVELSNTDPSLARRR